MSKITVKNTKKTEVVQKPLQKPLIDVENLNMSFKIRGLYFNALKNVSFSVNKGDFFGIIGESGSGKSTTGKCIIKLYQPTGGKIEIENHLVSNKKLSHKTNKWLRKNVQMIFQDPMASLNPTKNILQLISEPLSINKTIYKDAFKQWRKLNNVAKYYLLDFRKSKNELKYDFVYNYINNLNNRLKDFLNTFDKDFRLTDSYKITREKLIFKMDTLVEKSQECSGEINKFIKDSQGIIENLISKYNEEDYNEIFKNYEHDLIDLKNSKRIFKFSNEGCKLKDSIAKKSNELKEFKSNFYETYVKQNFGYIKSWETTTKSNLKTIKQNLNFSKNTIDYTIHFVNYKIQKMILLFVKTMNEYHFLEENQINDAIEKTQKIIEKLYFILNEKVMKLSLKFDNASIEEKNNIIEIFLAIRMFATCFYRNFKENNWNNYDHLKRQFSEIIEKCPKYNEYDKEIEINDFSLNSFDEYFSWITEKYNDLHQIVESLMSWSLSTKANFENEKTEKEKVLKELKKEFEDVHFLYIKSKTELEENKKNYNQSIQKFNIAKNNRKQYLENVVFAPLTSEQIQHKIKEKVNIKNLKIEHKFLIKEMKSKIKNILNLTKKQINEHNSDVKGIEKIYKFFNYLTFFKYLKRELNLRRRTLSALDFEFKNSIKELDINSFIFEKSRFINWILIPLLVDLNKKERVYKALDSVGLKREHAYRYPHEFSGGQRQRIVIARALINDPKVIIADEPISALDVSIQAQIINILQDLCQKKNVTILFIAHDLSMVNYACNNVIIMHRGRILEKGNVDKIFANPIHPYTRSLMKATPKLSRVHVDLAAFNEDFTYDKDWSNFNKPEFICVNNDQEHQVFGTKSQVEMWIKQAKKNKDNE